MRPGSRADQMAEVADPDRDEEGKALEEPAARNKPRAANG